MHIKEYSKECSVGGAYMIILITEIKNTCSTQLLVSCLTQSSGIHFYISKNKDRDILEYINKPIYKYHFTRKKLSP